MGELNETHQAQLAQFLSFCKGKRKRAIAEQEQLERDFRADRLSQEDQVFAKADVDALLAAYSAQVLGSLKEELDRVAKSSAAYSSQLMQRAEQFGVTLETEDIAFVEDQARVEQIAALTHSKTAGKKLNLPPLAAPAAGAAPAGAAAGDAALVQQLQETQEEVRTWKDRSQLREAELAQLHKERTTLTAELDKVKASFKQLRTSVDAGAPEATNTVHMAEIERALNETRSSLDAKTAECEEMRKDLSGRLGDSSQFRELKAIVKKKSDEVKELRRQLMGAGVASGAEGHVEVAPDDDD